MRRTYYFIFLIIIQIYSCNQIIGKSLPEKGIIKNENHLFRQPFSVNLNDSINLKQFFPLFCQQAGISLFLDPNVDSSIIVSANNRPFIEIIDTICSLRGLKFKIIDNTLHIEIDTPYPVNYNLQFLNFSRSTDNQISISTNVFNDTSQSGSTADNGSSSAVIVKGENDFWSELKANLTSLIGSPSSSDQITIHRHGGLITVHCTAKQHKIIKNYLDQLQHTISTQVLIEAKVIEVSLRDEFKAGINWHLLADKLLRFEAPLGKFAEEGKIATPLAATQQDIFSIGLNHGNFTGIIKALQQFGNCKTLSSPRLTVLNNQSAILKVAQNQVYFRLNYDKQYNLAIERENISVSSDIQTVPIGLVMTVQPAIKSIQDKIVLYLRPTISRLSKSISDPAVDIAHNASNPNSITQLKPSLIPIVEVREIDSVLEIQSGKIAVLGGLMEIRSGDEETKIPFLSEVPLIGRLFSATAHCEEVVELVILIKATILK